MTTSKQDDEFLKDVVGNFLLERAIEWIVKNMNPGEVFSDSQLREWATDNDYELKDSEW